MGRDNIAPMLHTVCFKLMCISREIHQAIYTTCFAAYLGGPRTYRLDRLLGGRSGTTLHECDMPHPKIKGMGPTTRAGEAGTDTLTD